jgi:hypothetical protein
MIDYSFVVLNVGGLAALRLGCWFLSHGSLNGLGFQFEVLLGLRVVVRLELLVVQKLLFILLRLLVEEAFDTGDTAHARLVRQRLLCSGSQLLVRVWLDDYLLFIDRGGLSGSQVSSTRAVSTERGVVRVTCLTL